jgi:hypothetical protein
LLATEVAGLVVGIGGAGAVIVKGGSALRRFGHFVDKLAGNGDTEPGILKRLEDLKGVTDGLKGDAAELKVSGVERDDRIDALTEAVQELGVKIDNHVDGDAQKWLADGQEWGNRLESGISELDVRVTNLEGPDDTQDPVVGTGNNK